MLNRFKTVALLGLLTALFLFIGQLFGGTFGFAIAVGLAFAMNFGAYWFSDKIVLKMYKAQEVTANEVPELYEMVKTLAERAGLPMPKVYIIPEQTPNAFATGRNPKNAAVAVTAGIMEFLTRD
ncbi:MAG TPA: M48 family metalloprotease, partial [Pyrinomonadaceae bacterium]|nr:M48 family metalloprotease [Pyrinomonadaceae bacterium]